MKSLLPKSLISLLVLTLALGPGLVQRVFAQDDNQASDAEIQTLKRLAKKGFLGDKKDNYLSAKSLTSDQVTDALVQINDVLNQVDLKSLEPGKGPYRVEDLQLLLNMVKDDAENIRDRKISAWKFEKRIEKIIAYSSEGAGATPTPAGGDSDQAAASAPAPKPTSTVTPVPGPNREEWDQMKSDIKDLLKKAGDFQDIYDKKIEALQKSDDDLKAGNTEIKTSNADNLEQLTLVKRLLDRVQDDLKKMDERVDQVAQKASEKSVTDTELEQELNIMHKDLRDNSQDVSILKQEVKKLDKTDEKAGQNPLDQALESKWLPGAALLVGVAALVVGLTKK